MGRELVRVMPAPSVQICSFLGHRKVALRKFVPRENTYELGGEVNEWVVSGVAVCVLVSNTWTSWEKALGLRVHGVMIKGTCAS